jgi:hypothetical protein
VTRRTVIIGDVHGCADELEDLLAQVALADEDRVVFVGDLVVRGPEPRRVVAIARGLGALGVRGNHEHRLLRGTGLGSAKLRQLTSETADALREEDWRYLRALPLWIDLAEHDARVVHAGVLPGIPIADQQPEDLMFLRAVDDDGAPIRRRGEGTLWGALYEGPPHIVFGHHALSAPQIHPWATGLDTGCVYGGELTALVLAEGEHVPEPAARRDKLVSVSARRVHCRV